MRQRVRHLYHLFSVVVQITLFIDLCLMLYFCLFASCLSVMSLSLLIESLHITSHRIARLFQCSGDGPLAYEQHNKFSGPIRVSGGLLGYVIVFSLISSHSSVLFSC